MKRMKTRVTRLSIAPEGENVFSEQGYTVEIDDAGGGEFVAVTDGQGPVKIEINPPDWPALREAIDRLIDECVEEEGNG
jgi:hypothetical protein